MLGRILTETVLFAQIRALLRHKQTRVGIGIVKMGQNTEINQQRILIPSQRTVGAL